MFEMPIKKRLKQLFCKHNYFAVALTENYKEPGSTSSEKVAVYKCDYCKHVDVVKEK
ncbi:hypothetical protein U8V72_25390 [Priestia filamentosa]|uniref:hypothetical protein n=1 Tax=Priestia filamentosa TaxID=1402861 RepID=UPI0039792F63